MTKHLFYTLINLMCYNFVCATANAQQTNNTIQGVVIDSLSGDPIVGATIQLEDHTISVLSDRYGRFILPNVKNSSAIRITHLGYTPKKVQLSIPFPRSITIQLAPDVNQLEEVFVSTGYETLPKERATGSFEKIDNQLFNRVVSTDVVSRLDGISSGILFDRRQFSFNATEPERLTIRGISTIRGVSEPLVILDNFPYEGNLADINPNDVADITILRDAAAASIWGARAGNGVIVITSKKGDYNKPNRIRFNSAVTLSEKPALMDMDIISSSDFIDVEQFLFEQGFYDFTINFTQSPLSPVTELLLKVRQGDMELQDAQHRIDQWRGNDVRRDFLNHVYRHSLNQQYALNLSGGSAAYAYTLSGGYDRNLESHKSNHFNRVTFTTTHRLQLTDRLDMEGTARYIRRESTQPLLAAPMGYGLINIGGRELYPYASLVDEHGRATAIAKDYRTTYTETAGEGLLLDWAYRPLEEARNRQINNRQVLRADLNANYRILPFLTARLNYMHEIGSGVTQALHPENSYYARNLVNLYTQVSENQVTRIIPTGSILDLNHSRENAYGLRGLLQANRHWGGRHHIAAIAGMEIRENKIWSSADATRYGYDKTNLTFSQSIDYNTNYPIYDGLKSSAAIPNNSSLSEQNNRFVSIFGNASYTLSDKYVWSGSFRRDASNIFGVRQNEKWSPLWSTGVSWQLSSEPWYNWNHLPKVKLRATYGYSGNIDPSVAAKTILRHISNNSTTGMPYASVSTGSNPNLRWEKVRTINFGIDIASRNNRINGSFEYYLKNTRDLISTAPLDPTLGFSSTAIRNTAKTSGRGIDIQLTSRNLDRALQWTSNFLFSYHKTIITDYYRSGSSTLLYVNSGVGVNPVVGAVISPIYSYAWGGLDPQTGEPIGFFNGEPSKDYASIYNDTPLEDLILHGSANPLYFGAIRNDFAYRNFSLSVNISWFFDYYFRKPSLNYASLYERGEGHGEFARRWQQPGDEQHTHVPSMPYPASSRRESFYQRSSINVLRGDHIRLQDIRLGYRYSRFEVYAYANNLGIIWRRNNEKLDPRTLGQPGPARSLALGLTINL